MPLNRMVILGFALSVLAVIGCGDGKDSGPKVSVKGRISDNGKPWMMDDSKMKLPPGVSAPPVASGGGGGMLQVAFVSTEGGDIVYAQLNATAGTFEVPSIKPGRYKIALYSTSTVPGAVDPFGGKFTQEKTKILRDIKGGEELDIDISKPQG